MANSNLTQGIYDNHLHFFYTSRKIIKNRQIDYCPIENRLFNITKNIYDFTEYNQSKIKEKCLRKPTSVFTYKLTVCKNIHEVNDLLNFAHSILTEYEELFLKKQDEITGDLDTCLKYISAEALEYLESKKDPEHFIYWDEKFGKYRTISADYLKLQESIFDVAGIYFLYDHAQELIYIGKSYHLWKRILTSSQERKASYCAYTIIGNKADTDIYEMYFISKYKPLENGTGKNEDSPTVTLPELEFSPLTQVYSFSDEKDDLVEAKRRYTL